MNHYIREKILGLLDFVNEANFMGGVEKFKDEEFELIGKLLKIAESVETEREKKKVLWCLFYVLGMFNNWKKYENFVNNVNRKVKEFEMDNLYVGYFIGYKQEKQTLWDDL